MASYFNTGLSHCGLSRRMIVRLWWPLAGERHGSHAVGPVASPVHAAPPGTGLCLSGARPGSLHQRQLRLRPLAQQDGGAQELPVPGLPVQWYAPPSTPTPPTVPEHIIR